VTDQPTPRPPARLAPALALCLNCGLALTSAFIWLHAAARDEFWRADFIAYYTAGAMVLDGEGGRLYDLDAQAACQDRVVPERAGREGLLPYINPPHAALPFALMALLPWKTAFFVWLAVQAGLLAAALRLLLRIARGWGEAGPRLTAAAVLALPPLAMTLTHGQMSLVIVVSLLGFYDALCRGRPAAAAAWLVLGTVKPQAVLLPAAVLAGADRRRELATAAGLFAAWAAATTAVLGWRCWPDFVEMVGNCGRQTGGAGVQPLLMYNLKMALAALLGVGRLPLVNALSWDACLVAAVVVAEVWRGPWRPGTPRFALRFALTVLLGAVVSPHFNGHDGLLLVVPAVLAYDYLRRTGRPAGWLAALLTACPLLFLADSYGPAALRPGGVRPFFLVMAGLTAWAAWALARARPAPRPAAA
jgi:hypothetical protein